MYSRFSFFLVRKFDSPGVLRGEGCSATYVHVVAACVDRRQAHRLREVGWGCGGWASRRHRGSRLYISTGSGTDNVGSNSSNRLDSSVGEAVPQRSPGVLTARLGSAVGRSRAAAGSRRQSRPVHQRLVSAGLRWRPAAPTRRGTARSASVSLAEPRSCRASTATAGGLESPHVGERGDGLRVGQAMLPSRRASQRCATGALRARLGASAAARGLADVAGRLHGVATPAAVSAKFHSK